MKAYVEPLKLLIYESEASRGEKAENYFGGFCECGGVMYQKSWHNVNGKKLLVSECEKCWKVKAFAFSGLDLVESFELKLYSRGNIKELLKDILTDVEYQAVLEKLNGGNYNYSAFSRAKKKVESLGIRFEELASYLL